MLAFTAVVMVALMGMLAMTLSFGAGTRQRRMAQTAADAGAIGGGTQIYRGMDSATVVAGALNSATRNGFIASEITINYPPVTGPHTADKFYVEVNVNRRIPTIFGAGSVLKLDSLRIHARAVAGLGSSSFYCVYALGNTGNAIDIPGALTASNCGVVSNSGISVKMGIESPDVAAVGTISGGPVGHSTEGIPPVPDPLASLQLPTGIDTVCTHTGMLTITKDTTLSHGVFCGGITINKNITATFGAGTYYIRGGGLNAGEVSALSGVTIINGIGANNDVAAFRPITFGNSCLFNITAPASGQYRGIAVFVDPRAPSTGPYSVNTVCGQGDINGTVYMPSQTFELQNSNGKLTITGTLIAKAVTGQNGGGKFWLTLNGSASNSAAKRSSLVE